MYVLRVGMDSPTLIVKMGVGDVQVDNKSLAISWEPCWCLSACVCLCMCVCVLVWTICTCHQTKPSAGESHVTTGVDSLECEALKTCGQNVDAPMGGGLGGCGEYYTSTTPHCSPP